MYVVLEGGDGVGKTTQIKRVRDELVKLGYDVIDTREPGGTIVGNELRDILFSGKYPQLSKKTQALLFMADRAEHYDKIVKPAIQEGMIVLQDRYIDSSLVYQGVINNLGAQIIGQISVWAVDMFMPDLVITLDGASKREIAQDGFHALNVEHKERIRKLYRTLAGAAPLTKNTVKHMLDADRDEDVITSEIVGHVLDRLKLANLSELHEPTKRVWQEK